MARLDTLKNYLQISSTDIDTQLTAILNVCETEYLNRTHQAEGDDDIIVVMAIERYNRYGNEGIASMNYSGINEAYFSDYSEQVVKLIKSKTRLKVL